MAKTSQKKVTPEAQNEEITNQKKSTKKAKEEEVDRAVEEKLIALYKLQNIDSDIDKIRSIRGELRIEVQDLEDQCGGLETRINKYVEESREIDEEIQGKEIAIKDANTLIKRYEDQQNNVRNNREYEALSKEVNYQKLEITLAEKHIKELKVKSESKKEEINKTNEALISMRAELELKRSELDDIIAETEKEEKDLSEQSQKYQAEIEERLLKAYKGIRLNARNGLAIVQIERDACGGCFNKIPPQRQMDIKLHKKIIVCEYCGRIIVDEHIAEQA